MKNNCYPSPFQFHLFFSLEVSSSNVRWYKIRHSSGLCLVVGGGNRLVTTSHCNDHLTWFQLDRLSTLKDANGLCILPVHFPGSYTYLEAKNSCPNPFEARYRQTALYSLQQISTGDCLHPRDIPARDNTPVIFNPTCNVKLAEFKLSSCKYVQHKCFVSVDDSPKEGS